MKTRSMYRVTGIKYLSKNIRYPFTDGIGDGVSYFANDAHARAKIVADKIMNMNEGSTVIDITNPTNFGAVGFTHHLKVIDGSRNADIADIYVYPIYKDNDYIYNYRDIEYNCESHEIGTSGFVFGYASTLFEALMFIDSFLFACDLQQKDKEE